MTDKKMQSVIEVLRYSGLTTCADLIEKQEAELAKLRKTSRFKLGQLPNRLGGFYHIHSGKHECGQAYWLDDGDSWQPCKKYVNHKGACGYEDNSAF